MADITTIHTVLTTVFLVLLAITYFNVHAFRKNMNKFHSDYMQQAIDMAKCALNFAEVPVGAVVIDIQTGATLGRGHNRLQLDHDPTAHAEIIAIRQAALTRQSRYLTGCALYTTLEPCIMCAGAIAMSRLDRLYYGLSDSKGGAVMSGVRFFEQPSCHHHPEIYPDIIHPEMHDLLQKFFQTIRNQ